ncbi:MAG: 16S rRNA (guanine(966)-N(2))-methyltransferase RsmD [Clostridia bacterium]|nr:16S rRNA (guanine(966)-N(2))-methyltransferase RsmD [Clostridia bacterium]
MRVITGTARGRRLMTLEGNDVRPTTDKVKEALFSILQFELEGRRVLDLFAGSGQLGIEALSRGAAHCVFIDRSKEAAAVVQKNLTATGLTDRAKVLRTDAAAFLTGCGAQFDLAFLDPPYGTGLLQAVLPKVPQAMRPGAVIVCEAPLGETLPDTVGRFALYRSYHYSKVCLWVYREPEEDSV